MVRSELTGPGGRFEVVVEDVDGRPMEVYKERFRSLREIPGIARRRGDDRAFIVHGERRIGFATFVDTANSVSLALAEGFDVAKGDRVAILAQNCPEWCLAFWGAVDAGAIAVGLNGWWKADEIVYGLNDSGSRVLVADAKRFERIADRLDEVPALEAVFVVEGRPPTDDPRLHGFDELTGSPTPDLPTVPIDEDDPAVILYTSGTTGRSKGAVGTHRNLVANLQGTLFNAALQAGPRSEGQTVSLFTAPLFHVSGLHSTLVTGLLAGIRLVMIEGRFDPGEALALIERERVSVIASVPTMVLRLCQHPDRDRHDLSSVRSVAYGGSPSADELQRLVRETFPNVKASSNVYGLTESASAATVLLPDEAVDRSGTVGRPVPTVRIRILGDDGAPAPPGVAGEVLIAGPTIMAGYWGKPEATAEAIDAEGWLHTGDIGFLDDDGYLTITDRKKDMIIRGGENIYCVEIENRLVDHPAIADAAVVGIPHPELGEEVKAFVQLEPGATVTVEEVRQWVAETLADFKVPAQVDLRTERLPRNASGKLLKHVLKGEADLAFTETM